VQCTWRYSARSSTYINESLSVPHGHSAAERIMSMKNFGYTIGNRTRDLSTCIALPQQNAPPRAPLFADTFINATDIFFMV